MKGKQPYRSGYQLRPEDKVQIACVQTAKLMRIPIFHIPNGIDIPHPLTRLKYQKMGLEPGVPDLCCPMPTGAPHFKTGVWVECKAEYFDKETGKKTGKGKISPEQTLWHERLRSWGYAVESIWTVIEFEAVMFKYYPTFAKRFAHI